MTAMRLNLWVKLNRQLDKLKDLIKLTSPPMKTNDIHQLNSIHQVVRMRKSTLKMSLRALKLGKYLSLVQ